MTEDREGIDVLQALSGAYKNLTDLHELHGLVFSPHAVSDVLVSTKDPGIVGTLEYEEGRILRIKNSFWALLYGVKGGYYPKNFFVNDISAIQLTENDAEFDHETVCQKISLLMRGQGSHFGYSLFHGEHTGNICLSPRSDNMFRKILLEEIGGQFGFFVLREFKYDELLFDIHTGKHRVAEAMIWKPDIFQFLSEIIEKSLLKFS